jgi:hypothetical protein
MDDGVGDASAFNNLPGGGLEPTAPAQLQAAEDVEGTWGAYSASCLPSDYSPP